MLLSSREEMNFFNFLKLGGQTATARPRDTQQTLSSPPLNMQS